MCVCVCVWGGAAAAAADSESVKDDAAEVAAVQWLHRKEFGFAVVACLAFVAVLTGVVARKCMQRASKHKYI